jgi:hypothetical protein
MQQLWQQSIDWDEPLNEQLQQEWLKLAVDLFAAQQTINTTSLPFNAHGFPEHTTTQQQKHALLPSKHWQCLN